MASKIVTLRRRSDFLKLTKTGKRIQVAPWLVINYRPNGLDHPRLGWTIPTSVGQAVIRNRLRRWCREIMRKSIDQIDPYDINFFFRAREGFDAKKLQFESVESKIKKSIQILFKESISRA